MRALATAVVALGLAVPLSAAAAQADDDLPTLPASDLDAAVAAAHAPDGVALVRRAAQAADGRAGRTGGGTNGGTDGAGGPSALAPAARPVVADAGVAVYGLSADFVRGTSSTPGDLWYVATGASVGEQDVTVFTTEDAAGSWHAVNVATGDTEARMARRAHGATLLTEPQAGAWYAVAHGRVRPLNASARAAVGASAVPLATYQRLVADRYGDKLPGSAYDADGAAGGYAPATVTPSRPDAGQAHEAPATGSAAGSAAGAALGAAGGALVLTLGGGLVLVRRRKAGVA